MTQYTRDEMYNVYSSVSACVCVCMCECTCVEVVYWSE